MLHTPSLFRLGSKKVKRRPPGNAYGSSAIVPPASLTAATVASRYVGVEQDERSAGLDVLAETDTADLAATLGCLDASGGRRIVGEPPAEGRAVEVLGRIHIGDGDLDIVDCVVHGRHQDSMPCSRRVAQLPQLNQRPVRGPVLILPRTIRSTPHQPSEAVHPVGLNRLAGGC